MSATKKYVVFAIVFLFALGADQATKVWARAHLKSEGHGRQDIVVVQDWFELQYSENEGSAFGLFRGIPGARYLLFAVGMGALVVVGSFLRRARPDQLRLAGELGLLAGGAVGNIVDRVYFGKVTDFIRWHYHQHVWPTFNVADAALVVGVIALLIDMREGDKAVAGGDAAPKRKK